MKTIASIITFALILCCSTVMAQNVVGKWKTIDDETGKAKSVVEIYKKGDVYEGKIIKLFRGPDEEQDPICNKCDEDDHRYKKKIIGMTIIEDMEFEDGALDEGTILDPNNGEVYECRIWVGDDGKLNVRGYVMFFFRTQTWLPYEG